MFLSYNAPVKKGIRGKRVLALVSVLIFTATSHFSDVNTEA